MTWPEASCESELNFHGCANRAAKLLTSCPVILREQLGVRRCVVPRHAAEAVVRGRASRALHKLNRSSLMLVEGMAIGKSKSICSSSPLMLPKSSSNIIVKASRTKALDGQIKSFNQDLTQRSPWAAAASRSHNMLNQRRRVAKLEDSASEAEKPGNLWVQLMLDKSSERHKCNTKSRAKFEIASSCSIAASSMRRASFAGTMSNSKTVEGSNKRATQPSMTSEKCPCAKRDRQATLPLRLGDPGVYQELWARTGTAQRLTMRRPHFHKEDSLHESWVLMIIRRLSPRLGASLPQQSTCLPRSWGQLQYQTRTKASRIRR